MTSARVGAKAARLAVGRCTGSSVGQKGWRAFASARAAACSQRMFVLSAAMTALFANPETRFFAVDLGFPSCTVWSMPDAGRLSSCANVFKDSQ